MSRDQYEFLRTSGSEVNEEYSFLFSEESIKYISNKVTQKLRALYPRGRPQMVDNDSIKGCLWEKYLNERKHPMVLREELINYFVNSIVHEKEVVALKNSYDPWIQNYDGNHGIVLADMNTMKLNHKKGERVNFDIRI